MSDLFEDEAQSLFKAVFSVGPEYMTLDKTNFNFKCVQTTRLVMMILIFILWLLQGFTLVRVAPFYISFWTLTFLFLALLKTSISAGRKVVENKMLENLRKERAEELKRKPGLELQLPPEDVKENWRSGIVLYSIALPLVCVSLSIFYFTKMKDDVVC